MNTPKMVYHLWVSPFACYTCELHPTGWWPNRAPVFAAGKQVNTIALLTPGPKLVPLKESEPNSLFIAITSLTTSEAQAPATKPYTTAVVTCKRDIYTEAM